MWLGVQAMWDLAPLLAMMLMLVAFSAFFSASEAALFSLRAAQRNRLKSGSAAQRLAYEMLEDPDRLLSAVLFWNLVVNIVYFALASLVGLRLQQDPHWGATWFAIFTIGSLLLVIFCSEMLPKTFAVLSAERLSAWVSPPLSLALRAVDPLMPALRLINLLSRRVIWPRFRSETYMQVNDLERAISLSTNDAQLIDREQSVLQNLVSLSDLRVDECMRPRSQLRMSRPPISWSFVQANVSDRYVFVTERDNDEIVGVLEVDELYECSAQHLERHAQQVLYAPWCASVADAWQMMQAKDRAAVAVVNERGETIGVVLYRDVLDIVFTTRSSRSERLFNRQPILAVGPQQWQVTGFSNLRVLERQFGLELPETSSVTIAGVMQECLQRLPAVGDKCVWGPFEFEVTDADDDGSMTVSLRQVAVEDER